MQVNQDESIPNLNRSQSLGKISPQKVESRQVHVSIVLIYKLTSTAEGRERAHAECVCVGGGGERHAECDMILCKCASLNICHQSLGKINPQKGESRQVHVSMCCDP